MKNYTPRIWLVVQDFCRVSKTKEWLQACQLDSQRVRCETKHCGVRGSGLRDYVVAHVRQYTHTYTYTHVRTHAIRSRAQTPSPRPLYNLGNARGWKWRAPLHICNSEEKVDLCSGRMNWPCMVCHLFKTYADKNGRPLRFKIVLCFRGTFKSCFEWLAPFLAVRTSPGKRKQPTLTESSPGPLRGGDRACLAYLFVFLVTLAV